MSMPILSYRRAFGPWQRRIYVTCFHLASINKSCVCIALVVSSSLFTYVLPNNARTACQRNIQCIMHLYIVQYCPVRRACLNLGGAMFSFRHCHQLAEIMSTCEWLPSPKLPARAMRCNSAPQNTFLVRVISAKCLEWDEMAHPKDRL